MGPVARWLYLNHRQRFVPGVIALSYLSLTVLVIGPATIAGAVWAELDLGQWVATFIGATVLGGVGVQIGVAMMRRGTLSALSRWTAGDTTDAVDAWNAVHRAPVEAVVRSAAATSALALVLFVPVVSRWSGLDGTNGFVVVAGPVAITLFTGGAIVIVGMTTLLRPLAIEIASHLPPTFALRRQGLGVRTRILLGATVASVPTGLYTAAAVSRVDTLSGQIGVAMAVAVSMGAFMVIIFDVAYVGTVSAPLRALAEATTRVADGRLDVPAPIGSADELGELTASFNSMQRGLTERAHLQSAFGAYVDPSLADRLLADGNDLFAGETVEVSILIVDIVDFTPFAEEHPAPLVVARLNELFGLILPILSDHRGHANKFLGDGLFAVFGAPERLDDHADRAVAAALEMQCAIGDRFGDALRVGIGINTGTVIVGTLGGPGKLEFSVVGDPANVASRVERLTRETGDPILVTHETLSRLTDPVAWRPRGEYLLKGKTVPIGIAAVDPWAQDGPPDGGGATTPAERGRQARAD